MAPAAEGEELPGLVTQHTPRLIVKQISIRIMEGLLAMLALVAFLLSRYRFQSVFARSASIADAAIVLSRSEAVARVLPVGAALTAEALKTKLGGRLFSSPPDLSAVEMIKQGQFDDDDDDDDAAAQSTVPMVMQSWRPYAVTRTAGVLLIITTIVLFSALEILYQLSTKWGGLVQVNMEGYTRYYWVVLPSAVMAALGLAYGSVDTGIRRLSPFLQLKSAAASKTERRDAIDAVQFQNLSYPVGTYSDLALALPDPASLLLRATTTTDLNPKSNGSAAILVRATVPAA